MSSKRRGKLEIIHDMLNSIQIKGGKIKPTHLLYKSNLSHSKMKEYLTELMAKEMIDEIEEKGKKMFIMTDKGHEFLHEFERIREFSDSFGL
jgi:predicted transcriptional regulator